MPNPSDPLSAALGRVVGTRWTRWRPRRTVPALAALCGVALLSLLGVTAPWASQADPVHGYAVPADTTTATSPRPVPPAGPPDPPPDRAQTAVLPPAADEPDGAPEPPAGDGDSDDADSPAPPAAPPSFPALTNVRLSIGGGLTATLYAGQLEEVIRRLDGRVTFNTDRSFRLAYPRLCVATVVVEGASGTEAAVYAHGLGPGWGGAEGVPDLRVAADNGTLHQQLVIPPSAARAGQRWTASASVHVDGSRIGVSSDYRLVLDTVDGSDWHWHVGNNGVTVECHPY